MAMIENVFYHSKDEIKGYRCGANHSLNQSSELNDVAAKLMRSVLQSAADACILQDTKKTRFVDLMSGLAAIFHVIQLSELMADVSTNNEPLPVFIVQDDLDCERCSGFYFFVGYYSTILEKLTALCEERHNLREYCQWY